MLSALFVVDVTGARPARADDVTRAQARVTVLQAQLAQTTTALTEGTRAWERDQASLSRVELRLRNTQRHVAAAESTSSTAQARLNMMAHNLYTHPMGGTALLVVQPPGAFLDALHAQELADRVAGTQQQVISTAVTARHRLREQQAEAEALAAQARALVDRSAATMRLLQALAESTSQQLSAAQSALQAARARRAADRARAARAARAARLRPAPVSGQACTGASTEGQQNGALDPASLCPLWRAPGQRLRADAAAAFNKMSQFHAATVGSPLCVTDSYRSYQQQVELYQRKPGLAAVPGTSEHGWGKAVDFCGGMEDSGSAAHKWMQAHAGQFGWFHPDWAEPSGSKPEAWHWEFRG